jgi:hypothetical protein
LLLPLLPPLLDYRYQVLVVLSVWAILEPAEPPRWHLTWVALGSTMLAIMAEADLAGSGVLPRRCDEDVYGYIVMKILVIDSWTLFSFPAHCFGAFKKGVSFRLFLLLKTIEVLFVKFSFFGTKISINRCLLILGILSVFDLVIFRAVPSYLELSRPLIELFALHVFSLFLADFVGFFP